MNKKDFLSRLKEDLSSLTDDERQNAIKYYEEYFDDAAEDAKEETSSQFMSPEDLAKKIEAELAEIAESENAEKENVFEAKTEKEEPKAPPQYRAYNPKKSGGGWKIIVLLCTFPLWLPLLIGLASAAFGLFMALLGIAFAVASIALAGFVMVGAGFMSIGYGAVHLFIDMTKALYPLGAGFVVAGVGLILGYSFTKLTALMFKSQFKFIGWAFRGITGKFSRQGA
ncbi:MAG: DUF1700 domain-containing protein [Oscillospiraceae bacterium]|nr:DUF1700 domain-containing protein [Oscillospiraceae bacterium]